MKPYVFKMNSSVKRMVFIVCMCVPYLVSYVCVFLCIPEASLELGKQRTQRKSSSIWLTSPLLIKVALWVETRKLRRYVKVETPQK